MTIISAVDETMMAMIVAIAAMRTSMPSARGTYNPSANRAIFATYPPLTHAKKRVGEARAREVKNQLVNAGANILGVVLNKVRSEHHGYGYGYYYYYGHDGEKHKKSN